MTTTQDLIHETRRYLLSTEREPLTTLNGSVDNVTTSWTFNHPVDNIPAGSYLSADLEVVYVWSVNEATNTVVIQRGMLGSTAASHADQTLVTVNPRFSDWMIFQALNSDMDTLSGMGLYQIKEETFVYNAAIQGYDLTGSDGTILEVLRVRYDYPGPSRIWPEILFFDLKRNQDTSAFPSGNTLVLQQAAYPGRNVRVTYSMPFTSFTSATDDVSTTGLPVTAYDLPPLGAAVRLSAMREGPRNFYEAQGPSRRGTEVPPGASSDGVKNIEMIRAERIASERMNLYSRFPNRRRT